MKRSLMVPLLMLVTACGDDASSPTDPSATPTPTAGFSTLTFTSTVTGSPVAEANVVVAGAAYTTNTDGVITLSAPAGVGATIDAAAPGFLSRVTAVRAESTFTLWQIPTGADTTFVRQLAYNRAGTPEVLWRPAAAAINLQLTGDLASDPTVRTAHVQAAAMATALTGGRVRVDVGGAASVTFTILLNVSAQGSTTTFLTQSGGTILGGRVEYASLAAARTTRVVAHEIGHMLGFGHAPSGLMCPSACGVDTFGPWDQDVFVSMWQRLPGTAALDNDRGVGARSDASTGVFNCDIK